MFLPKRRSTIAELQLQKANDGLRTEIVNLRHELTNKQGYAERLEVLLRERMERIDELTATIDQLRERNKRLEAEAEHLAKIAANRPADYPTPLGNILSGAPAGSDVASSDQSFVGCLRIKILASPASVTAVNSQPCWPRSFSSSSSPWWPKTSAPAWAPTEITKS